MPVWSRGCFDPEFGDPCPARLALERLHVGQAPAAIGGQVEAQTRRGVEAAFLGLLDDIRGQGAFEQVGVEALSHGRLSARASDPLVDQEQT